MKIIDLYIKIANGEELPENIIYDGEKYKITKILREDNTYHINYINDDMEILLSMTGCLNNEVEIIEEEKKIEKLCLVKYEYGTGVISHENKKIQDKINEIIDEINKLKESK